jgi:hypothetical protein
VAETVEPEWEPKPSTEAKINDANVMLQLCETIKTAPKPAEPANRAMMELFAKFGGDGEALQVLNKLAQLAATAKAA